MIGSRLGAYQITAKLGEGGMGEVYRATDSRLDREVAIKVLSPAFLADAERVARFEREAKLLAQLQHPHIAAVYGLEESDGRRALVMELVDGDDLSAVIERGPLPVPEALSIARQVADALEAAHEQGIVHRDLKPANIKLRADGTVKVLDFGLAKAMSPAVASGAEAMNSPTLTARGTQLGVILGTAAYMAPEQAKGKSVDRRADIWAFGVVLYEMLSGRRAFDGDDVSEVMASVLKTEPDWSAVPAETPPAVRRLLRRALEKDPRRRLSSIGDARLELDEIEVTAPAASAEPQRRSFASRVWLVATGVLAGVLAAAGLAALLWPSARSSGASVTRLSIVAPTGLDLFPDSAQVAISPDGSMVAFVTGNPLNRDFQLWLRPLDSLAARPLAGGDRARLPFWSRDSRSLGFVAGGKLKTLPVAGGREEVICDAKNFRGATWNRAGVIVFAPDTSGPLFRVSANGGEPVQVTVLDRERKESGHRFPSFLPDGEHFLYAALPGREGKFDIFAGSLRDRTRTFVGAMESAPVYAEPGWLLFARRGGLAAQRFDLRTLQLTGEAVALADEPAAVLDIMNSFTAGYAASVSAAGAFTYFSAPSSEAAVVWLDAAGKPTGSVSLPAGRYREVRISPDGRQAVLVRSDSRTESSLWLADLERGGITQLSRGGGLNQSPVWSPDGTQVIFASDRGGATDLFLKDISDAAAERPFYSSSVEFKAPTAWSPDGKWVVLQQVDPDTLNNIYLLPTTGVITPQPYVQGPGNESSGVVSPDGKWMAYRSGDATAVELYVQSFPIPGQPVRISNGGVLAAPWWSRDSKHLAYLDATSKTVWTVDLEGGGTLRVGTPRVSATLPLGALALDSMPDRQRWLALVTEHTGAGTVTVVQNGLTGLKK
ncbi:MAG: protein kinase [Acidobacteriota bacterium]